MQNLSLLRLPEGLPFHALLQRGAGQSYAAVAANASDADVGAHADYSPIEFSAGVPLLEADEIADFKLSYHRKPSCARILFMLSRSLSAALRAPSAKPSSVRSA